MSFPFVVLWVGSLLAWAPLGLPAQQGSGPLGLSFGGYLHALGGVSDLGYRPLVGDRLSGVAAEVLRLRWSLRVERGVLLEVHQRLGARATWGGEGGATGGLAVSAQPGRSVELETTLVDEERVRVWHDLDRLAVTVGFSGADLTLGRQGITWGISTLFPVADLWARFSPFELDTEEKAGVDALRFLAYPRDDLELDLVIADRGSWEDLSLGARATLQLASADVHLGAGKFWREVIALGGVVAVLEDARLRAEVALPWDLEADSLMLPRATLGADRIGSELLLSGELHFNGLGAARKEGYLEGLGSPYLARGESYFLGRWYLGGLVSRSFRDRWDVAFSAFTNLGDGSWLASPMVGYEFSQSTAVSLGGLLGLGKSPETSVAESQQAVLLPRSEFGTYGRFLYLQASLHF